MIRRNFLKTLVVLPRGAYDLTAKSSTPRGAYEYLNTGQREINKFVVKAKQLGISQASTRWTATSVDYLEDLYA